MRTTSGLRDLGLAAAVVALAMVATACGGKREGETSAPAKAAKDAPALIVAAAPPDEKALADYPKGTIPVFDHWPDGKIRSVGYLCDDQPIGPWLYSYSDGQKRWEGKFLYGGIKDGPWLEWYGNGQRIYEGSYIAGKEDGHWVWWHKESGRSMEGDFHRGVRVGAWSTWHVNGSKASDGQYLDGKKVGRWHYYHIDGSPAGDVDYTQLAER